MSTRSWRVLVAFAVLTVVAACGGDEAADETTTSSEVATTADASTTSEEPATTETTAEPETTTSATEPAELPGEPFDGFAREGDGLAVIGVAHDDVLNVRAGPGVDFDVVAEAGPTEDELVATGQGRLLPGSIWYEATLGGTTGWANASFLAFLGGTTDATAAYLDDHGFPMALDLEDLGRTVATSYASEDPPSEVVMVVAPTEGDLGEVTFDVVGIGDDSVRGFRLHVFAAREGAEWGLDSIEQTVLCARGTSGELCT